MSSKDFRNALITGFTTGIIAWQLLEYLEVQSPFGISLKILIILVPLAWIFGVWLGYFLGRWFGFFNSFGKFVAIGFTNSAVDFGVFNLLFALSDEKANFFPLFSTISFIVGVTHSYIWNKFWTFNAGESKGGQREFLTFIVVALCALAVNVGVSSLIFFVGGQGLSLDTKILANLGKVAGTACALIFSFIGFRLIVFKKK